MANYIVGLTGGIGSGKTTVANMFANFGVELIDADVVARQVVEPGSTALQAIVDKFGNEILTDDGALNRARLRKRVFANEQDKIWLNQLLHPVISQEMKQQLAASNGPYTLFIAPLLLENKLEQLCDKVVVVDVPKEIQLKRVKQRDNSDDATINAIIDSQIDRKHRLNKANYVVDNNQPLELVKSAVAELHARLLRHSQIKD